MCLGPFCVNSILMRYIPIGSACASSLIGADNHITAHNNSMGSLALRCAHALHALDTAQNVPNTSSTSPEKQRQSAHNVEVADKWLKMVSDQMGHKIAKATPDISSHFQGSGQVSIYQVSKSILSLDLFNSKF